MVPATGTKDTWGQLGQLAMTKLGPLPWIVTLSLVERLILIPTLCAFVNWLV